MTDEELVILFKNGNEYAYNKLYKKYIGLTISIIRTYIIDYQFVQDYSQDVWIKVFTKIELFDGNNFLAWLIKLIRNTCIDNHRRKYASNRKVNNNTLEIDDYKNIDDGSKFFDTKYDRKKDLIISEAFGDCLDNINEAQRNTLLLKLGGLKFHDISNLTKTNNNTLIGLYQKSIVSLMKELEKKGLISLKNINDNRKNKYKTPKDYKVSLTF